MKAVADVVKTDKSKCFFTQGVVNLWYLVLQEVVEAGMAAGEKKVQTNFETTGT